MELRTEIAHCSLALGYLLSREGRLEEAWVQLTRADETFVATGNRVDEARVKNELGRVAYARGNHDGRPRPLFECDPTPQRPG